MSVLSTYFIWNELLVPLWSRSCERQATRRANFSSGVNNFPNSSTCNPKYHIVEKKKLTLMPYITGTSFYENMLCLSGLWAHSFFEVAITWSGITKWFPEQKKWITTLRMVNIVWATLNACLQLWYITGR